MYTIKKESNLQQKLQEDTYNKLHATTFTVTGAVLHYFSKPNPKTGDMLPFQIKISTIWKIFKTASVGRVIVTRT